MTDREEASGARRATPAPNATSGSGPTSGTGSGSSDDESVPASSYSLMLIVVLILGLALLLLIVFIGVVVIRGQSSNDLNTLTSLIAGGFVGFLTPHVAGSLRGGGSRGGKGPR